MADFEGFQPSLLAFLGDLRSNNNRDWFNEHKTLYENQVREPALDFISAMGPPLARFAPMFVAVPKKSGGSLMRVYRDTRFSRDKTPYKTNVGIQFRHEYGKDVHAPGYYFHIDPDQVFLGAGIWRPAPEALRAIREAIVESPQAWQKVLRSRTLKSRFALGGESLTRPPRGFQADSPHIDDIKRKDFIAVCELEHDILFEKDLVKQVAAHFKAATPLMKFLCDAVGVPY